METISKTTSVKSEEVGARIWIGRAISGLVVLFMLFDGITKIARERHVIRAMAELGWPAGQTVALGLLVLACTVAYAVPRASLLGAILLTGFLGGATAAKARIEDPSLLFSVMMGVLAWAGLYLRNDRLRSLLRAIVKSEEARPSESVASR
jgi:hypothetical protein